MRSVPHARLAAVVALVALSSGVLVACQDARIGRRCNTTDFGQQNDLVLICKNGRWQRLMTKAQAIGVVAALKARETTTTTPPAPTEPPTTAAPETTTSTTTTSTTTTTIPGPNRPAGATIIGAGYFGSCARVNGGYVLCWGANAHGQLGAGLPISSGPVLRPVTTAAGTGVTDLHVGSVHTCALAAGAVTCWGSGQSGQLGNGTNGVATLPVAVSGLSNVDHLNTGAGNTCALISGEIWCWGAGTYGELGNGASVSSNVPVQVTGISSAVDVATSLGNFACAALSSGTVWCWGRNQLGQLGDGNVPTPGATSDVPSQVNGITDAEEVTVGDYSACALRSDNSIACWGRNNAGQLGDGTTVDSSTPVSVSGVADFTDVAGGAQFACGRRSGGTVSCWGRNNEGQLGDGTTTDSAVPVDVAGITTAVAVTAGYEHACALLLGGSVQCWGRGTSGELGNGVAVSSNIPLAVSDIP